MMSDFRPRAQQVMDLARMEAERLNHNYVGSEHLLLGFIKLGEGGAVDVLRKSGLDLETIRLQVEKLLGAGGDTKDAGDIPYTPRLKKVLALAGKEAKSLGSPHVGTEHMLLGLLCEGEGLAVHALKILGVNIGLLRNEMRTNLDSNFTPAAKDNARREPTPRAQRALVLARMEADRFKHAYVGTAHLLLGLITLGQGVAIDVLRTMRVDLDAVRIAVEKQAGRAPRPRTAKLLYTPRVEKVLSHAGKEAKSLKHSYVGTEHILLGILRVGEGVAARVLKDLGVEIERTRNEILKQLDPNLTPGAENRLRQRAATPGWLDNWWPPWKR
jgi:ATP-dependent Clp protease ATP-binding subunit ClpA